MNMYSMEMTKMYCNTTIFFFILVGPTLFMNIILFSFHRGNNYTWFSQTNDVYPAMLTLAVIRGFTSSLLLKLFLKMKMCDKNTPCLKKTVPVLFFE